jgi:predicted NBD/HSP70 family sugar kinase
VFPNRPEESLATAPAASAVLALLLTEGPLSRVDLARRLGLSSAAVTKAARPFLDDGYLHELAAERTAPGAGRPVSPLAVTPDREFFVGVKITADELFAVVCDLRATVRAAAQRVITDRTPDAVVPLIAALVDDLLDRDPAFRQRTRSLGVALSGDVDRPAGHVRYSAFIDWRDVPLADLLRRRTGLAVTVEQDVKALTVAEHWFGESVGADPFALITIGTGIGCGLVLGGRLLAGAFGVAGEIGHVCVDLNGPRCLCGANGCVETIASTRAIVEACRAAAGQPDLDYDGAVRLGREGDVRVREVFARAGAAIGLGIAAVVNIAGPERVVVSGEGLEAYDLLETHIREAFTKHTFGAAAECALTIRPLPFEEWARGAAAVAIQALFPHGGASTKVAKSRF